MSLSIIIVNYNTEELLINCISSIYANISIDNFEIIVVDNGSTDNSLSSLKERFPNVICVCNQKIEDLARQTTKESLYLNMTIYFF